MSFRLRIRSGLSLSARAAFFSMILAAGTCSSIRAAADTPQLTGHLSAADSAPVVLSVPSLIPLNAVSCGQVPSVGSISPFPLHLRVGGMLSPVTKLAVGADITISSLHLLPSVDTRIDGDAIFGSNLGGSQTIFPVTLDELYSRRTPGGTSIYFGPGAGIFFGGRSRFGGKVVLGASAGRFGVEAGLDFAGIGNPLFLLQGRVGL